MDDSNTVQKITLAYITHRGLNIITAAAHSEVCNSRKTVGTKLFLLSNLCVLRKTDFCLSWFCRLFFFFFFLVLGVKYSPILSVEIESHFDSSGKIYDCND